MGQPAREPSPVDEYKRRVRWSQPSGKTLLSPQATKQSSSREITTSHRQWVDLSLLEMSPHTSVCPIKGAARFFHVRAGDALNVNAAWTYPAPTPDAEGIRDYIAFWKGVDVA